MPNILDEIVAHKRAELALAKERIPLEAMRDRALRSAPAPSLSKALRAAPMGLIAEIKHRSPSAGVIRTPFDPASMARAYEQAGAQGLSCLMDEAYFGGGAAGFAAARAAVKLPMLFKEFVVDPWQAWQARSLGASAILLIASVLSDSELHTLSQTAREAELEVLLEVHNAEEMARACAGGFSFVGINNRDLTTFTVSLETTARLAGQAPEGAVLVAESGVRSAEDVRQLKEYGAHSVLVGETLLRQPDLKQAVHTLMEQVWGVS